MVVGRRGAGGLARAGSGAGRHPGRSALLAAALGVVGGAACGGGARAERGELGALAVAIDALRDAPLDAKAAPLAALRATPCAAPEACRLRDDCAAAYTLLVEARRATRAVEHALAVGADAGGAPRLLDQTEAALRRADTLTQRCAAEQRRLRPP